MGILPGVHLRGHVVGAGRRSASALQARFQPPSALAGPVSDLVPSAGAV